MQTVAGTCEVQDAATAADKELFLFKSDARLTDYFFGPTGAITMLPDLKPVEVGEPKIGKRIS